MVWELRVDDMFLLDQLPNFAQGEKVQPAVKM